MAAGEKWKMTVKTVLVGVCATLLCAGCIAKVEKGRKLAPSEYTVLAKDQIPEELAEIIEEKKAMPFEITYEDGSGLYAAQGYGPQLTSGYSIRVNNVYVAKESVTLDTTLLGPDRTQETEKVTTFPYVVVLIPEGKS